jgi:hypothetical protein
LQSSAGRTFRFSAVETLPEIGSQVGGAALLSQCREAKLGAGVLASRAEPNFRGRRPRENLGEFAG